MHDAVSESVKLVASALGGALIQYLVDRYRAPGHLPRLEVELHVSEGVQVAGAARMLTAFRRPLWVALSRQRGPLDLLHAAPAVRPAESTAIRANDWDERDWELLLGVPKEIAVPGQCDTLSMWDDDTLILEEECKLERPSRKVRIDARALTIRVVPDIPAKPVQLKISPTGEVYIPPGGICIETGPVVRYRKG